MVTSLFLLLGCLLSVLLITSHHLFYGSRQQLNLYGFTRITRGPQKGCYFHELFQKDRPELAARISRKKLSEESDADADLAPAWLADASAVLEPTPIGESLGSVASTTSSSRASMTAANGKATKHWQATTTIE